MVLLLMNPGPSEERIDEGARGMVDQNPTPCRTGVEAVIQSPDGNRLWAMCCFTVHPAPLFDRGFHGKRKLRPDVRGGAAIP
jgi:hypothetical protein